MPRSLFVLFISLSRPLTCIRLQLPILSTVFTSVGNHYLTPHTHTHTTVHHYGLFPKSVSEVVSHYQVQEAHLSLTQGKWRTRVWGYPPDSTPPGAELWVWFLPNAE